MPSSATGPCGPSLPLPAHQTKHLQLEYQLYPSKEVVRLVQDDTLADSTGRTLWLSAQILSCYLLYTLRRPRKHVLNAIDLGAGTGLLSLSLASKGYNVTATDIPAVLESVTRANVLPPNRLASTSSKPWGTIEVSPLDWTEPIPKHLNPTLKPDPPDNPVRIFDLIVTADTVYTTELIAPLLRTLLSLSFRPLGSTKPRIYLALERRDPGLVEQFFEKARVDFVCEMVDMNEVRKAVEGLRWDEEDWEGGGDLDVPAENRTLIQSAPHLLNFPIANH